MTTPDSQDWVPPQTGLANDQLLLQTLGGGTPTPFVSAALDVAAWASLTCLFSFVPQIAGQFVQIQVQWTDAGGNILSDAFTIGGTGNPAGSIHSVETTIPCRGRTVKITMQGDGSNPLVFATIVGSTRILPAIILANENNPNIPIALAAAGEVVGAGATVQHYIGPFAKGFFCSFSPTLATVTIRFLAMTLIGGVWTPVRCGEVIGVAGQDTVGTFLVGRSVIRVDVFNSDAAPHSWSGSVGEIY